ncbi:Fatty acid metabolism regulator protein [compost metagenome]
MPKVLKNKFQLKREATYAQLIRSGMKVLCERGYTQTTVDDIANEAGFSKGAFYVHFKSKEDFMLEMIEYRAIIRSEWTIALRRKGNESLEELVSAAVDQVFEYLQQTPEWSRVYIDFFTQSRNNEAVREKYKEYYGRWLEEYAAYIRELQEQQLINQELSADFYARTIYALLEGMIVQWNIYGEQPDKRRFLQAVLRLLQ